MGKAYQKEKESAINAVMLASDLARSMQGKLAALDVVNKEDLSPVTITDFSVQALVNMRLREVFPNDSLVGEEDALLLSSPQNQTIKRKVIEQITSVDPTVSENEILAAIGEGGEAKGRYWVLDPIDGTRGFIRQEQYCVALALVEEGEVVLGVLGCPRFPVKKGEKGALFVAVKRQGCERLSYETGDVLAIHVTPVTKPEDVIYCEPHVTSRTHAHSVAFEIAKKLKAHPRPFRLDSQVKYAHVANGDTAIYLRIPTKKEHVEKIWDHAAGMLIVEEAGGRVTDMRGKALDFSCGKTLTRNEGIVATNGFLHEEVLKQF
ncbi:MAG: 3'(2'),5'-bisphosphate nucleotidase CysQ [Chlamydiales bacterium]|nr:3'(2'),5'-bisphosphate nucleotidase CysQ [Chlamydiales bacterium]